MPKNRSKSFWALIFTQFTGAFNDNVFKLLVSLLVVAWVSDPGKSNQLVALGTAVFAAPFLMFSMAAGRIADRVSKSQIILWTKLWEVGVVLAAILSLWQRSIPLMMISLFMLSLQATFFSPAKYGVLPELVDEADLSGANAWLNIATFAAILAGTLAAAYLVHDWRLAAVTMAASSLLGLAACLAITRLKPAQPDAPMLWNPWTDLAANWRVIAQDRALKRAIIAVNFFWFMGAALQTNLILYARQMMNVGEQTTSYLIIAVGLGIGAGSYLAARLSAGKVELGLVPLGALGMTFFGCDLLWAHSHAGRVFFDLFMLGAFAGLYDIPLVTLIQWRSPAAERGKVLATSNFLSFVAIGLSSLVLWTLGTLLRLNPAQVFFALGVISLAGSVMILRYIPDYFLRLVFYLVTNTIYRIRVTGREHLPVKGPALLVANHLSMADGFLVGGALPRLVRFLIWRPFYNDKRFHGLLKTMRAIPISEKDPPKEIMRSLLEARRALEEGHLVCIFAEGEISRTGNLLEFKRGFEVIVKGLDVPVIPVLLDRVWGSIFSFEGGTVLWKKPRRIPYPVSVTFGAPLKSPIAPEQVRQAVLDLGAETFMHRFEDLQPLPIEFLRRAKRRASTLAVADSTGRALSFGRLAAVGYTLSKHLEKVLDKGERHPLRPQAGDPPPVTAGDDGFRVAGDDDVRKAGDEDPRPVGLMLPPSVGGAVANVAVALLGRLSVNLNYTVGPDILARCIEKAGITRILTSRALLQKTGLPELPSMLYLEDVMAAVPRRAIALNRIIFSLLPARWLLQSWGAKARGSIEEDATILFSSGSTGVPKGVVLSHRNVLANILGLGQVYDLGPKDRIAGILPFFHSFGFTGTLWFPLIHGFGAVYHTNPLDSKTIGELVQKFRATLLLAMPTFLAAYTRKCTPEQFASLRFVITGAERLREGIARAFEDKFGKTPLEGYGCTELSPVATANIPDVSMGEITQVGQKPGKIGHPIPGVSVRVVDPESFAPVPQGEAGLLLVKGPNVMKGYWKDPEKTRAAMREDWYITGDIASIDNDGFVQITDRLSRFSKIGGEMVPHVLIEEKLHALAGRTDPTFVVTGVPDEKRGEKLVVLCAGYEASLDDLYRKLNESDLAKLWIPGRDMFFAIPAIPYLGTGKVDLAQVRQLAGERVQPV